MRTAVIAILESTETRSTILSSISKAYFGRTCQLRIVKEKEKWGGEGFENFKWNFLAKEIVHAKADRKVNFCYSRNREVIRGLQDGEQVAEREHAVFLKFLIEQRCTVSLIGCFQYLVWRVK